MSAKMARRKRHDRMKRVRAIRTENALFFGRGTIPATATSVSMCLCGAVAFSRDRRDDLSDFSDVHSYCDEAATS